MKIILSDLNDMSEEEYTEAYLTDQISSLVREYQMDVSSERVLQLVDRIEVLKKNGLKPTQEEENN